MATATVTVTPAVGDVLVSSWGYDQTNVDFYQVVAVTPRMITMRPIVARMESADGGWTGQALPCPGYFVGDQTLRRKVHPQGQAGYWVSVNDVAGARLWDGLPANYSSYA